MYYNIICLLLIVLTFNFAKAQDSTQTEVEQAPVTENVIEPADNFTWQLSFVPKVSTQCDTSADIVHNLSINIIGGYNSGLNGFELGLGFNIMHNDVQGVQMAGLGNTVLGDVKGAQFGNFYNVNLGHMRGFQAAGFVNVQIKTFTGVQASSGVNYADSLKGVQMAMANVVRKETQGAQIGLLNYTKELRGFQLGLLNIADTAKGTPVGLLSIVRKGYWHFDVYGDELTYANVSFRTGVHYFHNIITAGFTPDGEQTLWRVGYGLGTEFSLGKKKKGFTNVDLTVSYINRGKDLIEDLNMLTTLNWDFGFRLKDHVGVFFGPSLKLYTSKYVNTETGQLGMEDISWNSLHSEVNNGFFNDMWGGVRGGLRF